MSDKTGLTLIRNQYAQPDDITLKYNCSMYAIQLQYQLVQTCEDFVIELSSLLIRTKRQELRLHWNNTVSPSVGTDCYGAY